ncbi:hypothetical protein [Mucilaginibacter terrenus]|uniref:hypothetical protein n=1 Tax=Mucilaginibacter terrenus TaxID=2482727 RepID=UPI001058A9C2|nr:hypothetical protein [Mucilaginibacter terrenus]
MKTKLLFALVVLTLFFASCNTYYVASTTTPIDIYPDLQTSNISYNVPGGTVLLIKGNAKNGMRRVRYHSDPNWYWVSASNLSLVPGFNPKYYDSTYANYENSGSASTSAANGYDATIQTGSRGGKYYINKNGNKTYVKRSTPSGTVKHVGGRGSRGGRH